MPKRQPLYPHVPATKKLYPHVPATKKEKGTNEPKPNIYCYIPGQRNTVGLWCVYASSRDEADQKAQAVDYYELQFSGTWDELGERIKKEGQKNWLGEVGY